MSWRKINSNQGGHLVVVLDTPQIQKDDRVTWNLMFPNLSGNSLCKAVFGVLSYLLKMVCNVWLLYHGHQRTILGITSPHHFWQPVGVLPLHSHCYEVESFSNPHLAQELIHKLSLNGNSLLPTKQHILENIMNSFISRIPHYYIKKQQFN